MLTWIGFIICAVTVFLGGVQVAKAGDVIAQKTGLGRTWIGVVLLASITSLPEAVNGFTAVVVVDAPRIAVGDIIGSCAINLLIIALLDSTSRTAPLLSRVSQGHVLSAAFAITLLGSVLIGFLATEPMPTLLAISPVSIVLVLVYLFAMRVICMHERREQLTLTGTGALPPAPGAYEDVSLRHALYVFGFNGAIIVVAASFLPAIGQRIAAQSGLGESFVGTILIALATSLPEIAIALTAIHIGASDLALGGLLGSNLFNLGMLGFFDFLHRDGSIFLAIPPAQVVTVGIAAVMTSIVIIGLTLRPAQKPPFLAWDAISMVAVFLAGTLLFYALI